MKRVLRSVILLPDDDLDREDAVRNGAHLRESSLEFEDQEDREIWDFVRAFYRKYSDVPTISSVRDHFRRKPNNPVLERLDEIQIVGQTYTGSDFQNLVRALFVDQKNRECGSVLSTAAQITFKGIEVGRGRNKEQYEGSQDAFRYVLEHADDFMVSDGGTKLRGDVTQDYDGMIAEFEHTLENPEGAWGIVTSLDKIDVTCRGIKRGELWLHAGFTGQLKCVAGDVRIYDHAAGRLRTARELFESGDAPVVTALNREGLSNNLVEAQALPLVENGVRPVHDLVLESGRRIRLTDNHPLYVAGKGWVELGDIDVGQYVAFASEMCVSNPRSDFADDEVKAIGYMIGDGSMTDYLAFTCGNDEIREDFVTMLDRLGYREGSADYETPTYRRIVDGSRTPSIRISHSAGDGNSEMESPLRIRLEALGLWGKDAHGKFVPGEFFGLPDDQIALLLGALWSTDGSVSCTEHVRVDRAPTKNDALTYSTVSRRLAEGVQGLLQRLGIRSHINECSTDYNGSRRTFYSVRVVTNLSKRRFCEKIRVVGKQERVDELRRRIRDVDDRRFPTELMEHLDAYDRAKSPTGHWRYAGQAIGRDTITADGLRIFAEVDPDLAEHVEGDLAWDRVVAVKAVGEEMTYDLSVPEHHSFIANGIVTHNTTFALNWVYKAAIVGKYNCYYFSLEMPYEQVRRILCVMHSNHPKFKERGMKPLDYRVIRDGIHDDGTPITDEEKRTFYEVMEDLKQGSGSEYGAIIVERPDGAADLPYISQRMEISHQEHPLHMAVVDHFGLVEPTRNTGNYYTDLNSVIRSAKKLAMNFAGGDGVALVGLHQMNRQGKDEADKNDGRYRLQALADANEAERSSDVISYTYVNRDLKDENQVLVGNLKNRDNPLFTHFRARVDFPSRFISNLEDQTVRGPNDETSEIIGMLEG